MVLTFESLDETQSVTIQMKATEKDFIWCCLFRDISQNKLTFLKVNLRFGVLGNERAKHIMTSTCPEKTARAALTRQMTQRLVMYSIASVNVISSFKLLVILLLLSTIL